MGYSLNMKRPNLSATMRTLLGKKVKKLRREGILPANVYGKDVPSTALQVNLKEFIDIYKEVGETGLVDLEVDGQKRPVLIKNVQFEFRNNTPLHADFYQVNLKEKVKTMVPIELVGEAKAVAENIGTLIHPLSEIEVEALPTNLPEKIEVNIENLANIDDHILVSDIQVPEGVTVLTDPGQVIAKISEIVVEETPQPEAEEGATESAEGAQEATESEEKQSENQQKSE